MDSQHAVVDSLPPIAEPRFDEAGKRLRGPERGAAPAGEPKGQVSVA